MTDISLFLLICLLVFFIIILILFFTGAFKQYKPDSLSASEYTSQYIIPSVWSYDPPFSTICYNEITGQQRECKSSAPVDDPIDGSCNVYTFVSTEQYQPASFSFNDINSCSETTNSCSGNKNCACQQPYNSQQCIDADQLFSIKLQQICYGFPDQLDPQVNWIDQCLASSGELVPIGAKQEFFTTCSLSGTSTNSSSSWEQSIDNASLLMNNGYCFGVLAILVFNLGQGSGTQIFDNALCIATPSWEKLNAYYSDLAPIKLQRCNLTLTQNGIPTQLFRFQRAEYVGTVFKQSNSGCFCRIIQRPSEYSIYPTLNASGEPVVGSPLTFIQTNETTSYCWYLMPQLKKHPFPVEYGSYIYYSSLQQFIYIKDPKSISQMTTDQNSLWDYIINNKVYAIQPETVFDGNKYLLKDGGNLILGEYLLYNEQENADSPNNSKALICNTNYLDYAILPLITSSPQNFTFYS